jgi:hypothetical protein
VKNEIRLVKGARPVAAKRLALYTAVKGMKALHGFHVSWPHRVGEPVAIEFDEARLRARWRRKKYRRPSEFNCR